MPEKSSEQSHTIKARSAKSQSFGRLVLLSAFLVVVIGGVEALAFFYFWPDKPSPTPATNSQDPTQNFIPEENLPQALQAAKLAADCQGYFGTDSDQDLLSDNLEKKFGTDPFNQDTDSDGTNDRQEIEAGENPLGDEMNTIKGEEQDDWIIYRNEQYAYRLKVPASFRVEAKEESRQINFFAPNADPTADPELRIFVHDNEKNLTLENALISWYVEADHLISLQVNGQPAQQMEKADETKMIIPRKDRIISLTYFENEGMIESIIQSLEWEE